MTRASRRATPEVEGLEGRQLLSTLIINRSSGQALDDPNGAPAPGIGMIQWTPNGGPNQQWDFRLLQNGDFIIQNVNSGKVLDDPGASPFNLTPIIQSDWAIYEQAANQWWKLDPVYPFQGYFEIQNVASGKFLDDPASSIVPGTQIIQYDWNGGANQQWHLDCPLWVDSSTIENSASGQVLDDPNYSVDDGTQIIQWGFNDGPNQWWNFLLLNDGEYVIQNAWSGLVLTNPGSSLDNGTGIVQQEWKGGANQQWVLEATNPGIDPNANYGWFRLVNLASGQVLDDPNSSRDSGTGIIQWERDGGNNQLWSIGTY
jgi:hypothetical protein